MKTRSTEFICIALLLACGWQSQTTHAGLRAVEGRQFLLVVGTDSFPRFREIGPFKYARADAESFASALSGTGYEVISLLGEGATRRDLVRSLYRLSTDVQEFDTLVVYCSLPLLRRGTRNYLITYDASRDEPDVDAIRLEHFLDMVADIPAGKKLIIFDANLDIRSGVFTVPAGSNRGEASARGDTVRDTPDIALRERLRGNTSVIAVTLAFELEHLGHGALMFTLLEGITQGKADADRDGEVGVQELAQYATSRVPGVAQGQRVMTYNSYEYPDADQNWLVSRVGGSAADIVDAVIERLAQWHLNDQLSVNAYFKSVQLLRQSRDGSLKDDDKRRADQLIRYLGTNPSPEIAGRFLEEFFAERDTKASIER